MPLTLNRSVRTFTLLIAILVCLTSGHAAACSPLIHLANVCHQGVKLDDQFASEKLDGKWLSKAAYELESIKIA